ncbi:umta methyltransferase family protein [Grosmannia clavigera kw1407]|uniref:Umta methyltransferase family protein n=1 Tax=Grosmannia clavigera (strain kw1407 / UAMH 11150) TaxID=655863 RepID=F0X8A9_GROCL|nr:umta methyltransferase family protein [Grosmannia clavigera kw1407]EFX05449.1 umta methyltransferase family protein [Grosmannia clavigera kw1407]
MAEDTVEQGLVQVDSIRDDDPGYDDGASYEPNDNEEQERMDLVHHIYRLLLKGALHLAPISEHPQRVLDLGTGTGIWALEFADEYPSAEVLGSDLSPIQPQWTAPNCSFEVDDFEDNWTYNRKFDYIHTREIGGSVADIDKLIQRAYEHLAPGGYFEIQTSVSRFVSDDGSDKKAPHSVKWASLITEALSRFGKPCDTAPEYKDKINAAGFVDVQQDIRKLPIGAWPKDPALKTIGRYQVVQQTQAVDSYTPGILSNVLNWKDDEIQVLVAKAKKDLKNPEAHLYLPVYFIWGRKPLAA